MSVVELSDEETVAILSETFVESLADIGDKTRQIAVLKRLHRLLDSSAPQRYIYESLGGYDELQVIRVGGDQRLYCHLVVGIPHEDQHYNVLFVFDVDRHQYRPDQLATFDLAAKTARRDHRCRNHRRPRGLSRRDGRILRGRYRGEDRSPEGIDEGPQSEASTEKRLRR